MADHNRFAFGDTPQMADELLSLVIIGRKTGTCWAAAHGQQNVQVGDRSTVLNGQGRECAVIETIALTERRFDEIDAEWAAAEGEGDRSLAYWRQTHEDYFTREGNFAPDMPLWCERFRLVAILPRGAAR